MKFSLLILGAPGSDQSVHTALQFARAALAGGHEIYRVFFYHDAVHAGTSLSQAPQDSLSLPDSWRELGLARNLDMVVCISSALRRGILDNGEAERYEKPCANLAEGFALSGLGQWVDACLESDRVLTFGV